MEARSSSAKLLPAVHLDYFGTFRGQGYRLLGFTDLIHTPLQPPTVRHRYGGANSSDGRTGGAVDCQEGGGGGAVP